MTQPILEYQTPIKPVGWRPFGVLENIAHVAFGVLLPMICFIIAAEKHPLAAEYQSGAWHDYVSLIPSATVSWPFFPLMALAMACLLWTAFTKGRAAENLWVRIGLYGGVVIAVQYTLIQAIVLAKPSSPLSMGMLQTLGGAVLAIGLAVIVQRIWSHWYYATPVLRTLAICLFVSCGLALALSNIARAAAEFGALAGAPALAAASYLIASVRVFGIASKSVGGRNTLAQVLTWLAWLLLYGGAWRETVRGALVEYAALPKTQPDNCYVGTAASQGHERVVGAYAEVAGDGSLFQTNRQVRRLKEFEIALRALSPAGQRRMRAFYDRVGPVLARGLRHAALADAAYLMLKPAEWVAGAMVWFCS
ncbi:MAG TPA: DUF6688 family protein [Tepidisphaeraceae bacterium]|jgi:hypothetical protein